MKTKRHTKNNPLRILLIAVSVIVVLGIGVGAYVSFMGSKDTPEPPVTQQNTDATEQSIQDKSNLRDKEEAQQNQTQSSESTTQAAIDDITATTNDAQVIVQTKLIGVDRGTCTLTVTSSSQKIKKEASIIYNPSYSTCAGFTIQKSELPAGTWTLTVDIDAPTSTVTKSLTLEVRSQ